MSICEVAQFTGLNWESVKNIEKKYLSKKYKKVRKLDTGRRRFAKRLSSVDFVSVKIEKRQLFEHYALCCPIELW